MKPFKFDVLSVKARLAGAVFGLVCSLAVLSAVVVVFASASGELEPALAKMKAAPAASDVASKAPARPARG